MYAILCRIKPENAEALYDLGSIYCELEEYKEAIKVFKRAISIKSDYANAHYGLGFSYFRIGNKDFGLKEYEILKNLDINLANKLSKDFKGVD